MKRILKILLLSFFLIFLLISEVQAEPLDDLSEAVGADELSYCLPKEVKEELLSLGIDSENFATAQNLSFSSFAEFLLNTVSKEAEGVFPSVAVILSILLLYTIFTSVFESVSNPSLSSVLSVVSALCIACVLLMPAIKLMEQVQKAITLSADFMLAYIPVMTAVLISSGQYVTGSGYSAMMILCAQGVGQFFTKIISPLLSCFLSLGISSSIVPDIKLNSMISFFSKSVKWLMSFVFTLFTSFLTLKSLYATSVDNVSSRAVRYTMSSFVPVVGGALSEAYRTVHGSVGVLKSGIGVFVIISVAVVFLPVIIRLLLWLFTVNICKGFAETSSLHSPVSMLSAVSTVLSLMLSVVFCIIALFIITTALIISIGGA